MQVASFLGQFWDRYWVYSLIKDQIRSNLFVAFRSFWAKVYEDVTSLSIVDYQTAQSLLTSQGVEADRDPDTLLSRLKQGQPPIPGQVTAILLALKVVADALRSQPSLERHFAGSLHLLATESRTRFEAGKQAGVPWPPLLDEDLTRIAEAVRDIFIET
jgi:hypothetical protein